MSMFVIVIEKAWDGNECEREVNGRFYLSRGRWQWIVVVDGEADFSFARLGEAEDYVRRTYGDAVVPKRARAPKAVR